MFSAIQEGRHRVTFQYSLSCFQPNFPVSLYSAQLLDCIFGHPNTGVRFCIFNKIEGVGRYPQKHKRQASKRIRFLIKFVTVIFFRNEEASFCGLDVFRIVRGVTYNIWCSNHVTKPEV